MSEDDKKNGRVDFEEAGRILLSAESVLIASHEGPEADAIGSSLALGLALENLGKKVWIYNKDGLESAKYLPGYEKIRKDLPEFIPDIFCVVDCATLDRIGKKGAELAVRTTILNIDHHKSSELFGTFNLIIPDAPACGIIIYELLEKNGWKITKDIATNIYAAIAKDTMCFLLHTVDSKTLNIASKLVEYGAEVYRVMKSIRYSTERKFKLLSTFLSRIKIINGIATSYLYKEDYEKVSATKDDSEDFIDLIRSIDNVKGAIFVREDEKGLFKVSMRSDPHIDVGIIAREYGGGGHKNAAGFNTRIHPEEIIQKVVSQILDQEKNI
ncbi:MAG: bifunctional oligoribonuclease/PAP phosphatase NrnA [Candidatus Calescibacterium sp.]|nr:bifunctional oligoribonuclease/PAP phosphatase NrnA [Candidatus Calescibacterium sp.]MCX7733222.1 bifunctional oligoribonuclease/PAP phosphatase NrnA [bacterium]MDW8086929.1 bifunctional oligoribonuclease/PAP phosphatase NrnA [Candidatus Calescibacterium sp.]